MFFYQSIRSPPDNRMKMGLDPKEHAKRNPVLVHGLQNTEKRAIPLSFGHVDRAFTAGILKRPPRSHSD